MRCEHGRRNGIEKFAYGGNHSLFRRSVGQKNHKTYPKDFQLLEFAPRDSGLRAKCKGVLACRLHAYKKAAEEKFSTWRHCYMMLKLTYAVSRGDYAELLPLFTIIFVDSDAFNKASSLPSLLPNVVERKHFESESPSNMDGHEPPSPQLFMVGLQTANTDFSRSNSSCISSEGSSSGQSTKVSSPIASPLPCCLSSGNSSGSVCDKANVCSDFLVNDFPKMDKRVKRNPRKKGKKKGKHYKRSSTSKVSTELNVQCNEDIYKASSFETSTPSSICSSGKHLSDNNLSDEAAPNLLDTHIIDKDDISNNIEFVESPQLFSCTSCNDEMDDFEHVSSPHRFSGDEVGCNISNTMHSSCIIDDAEAVPFNFDVTKKDDFKEKNNTFKDLFSSISVDKSLDFWHSDIGENSSDDIAMQIIVKDESVPSSSEGEVVLPSEELKQCDTSSHTTTANLCHLDSEISKDSYRNDAYLSNDVHDAYSCTERADCSSQAGSSNDFHPVISGKRCRRARRMSDNGGLNGANRSVSANMQSHVGKDNNYSIWQKVQKCERKESVLKPNNVSNVLSPPQEVSGKDMKSKMKNTKFVGLKQKQSGMTYKYPCSDAISKSEPSQMASKGPKASRTPSKLIVGNSMNVIKSKSSSVIKHGNQQNPNGSKTDIPDTSTSKHQFQQKEEMKNSSHVPLDNCSKVRPNSPCNNLSSRCSSKLTENIGCHLPEPEQEIDCLLEETRSANVCDGGFHLCLPSACNEISCTPNTLNPFGQKQIETIREGDLTRPSDPQDCNFTESIDDQQFMKTDSGSYKESNNLSNTRTPVQKWVPVGRKDSVVSEDSAISDIGYSHCLKDCGENEELNQLRTEATEVDSLNPIKSVSTGKDGDFSHRKVNKLTNKTSSYHNSTEPLGSCTLISSQTYLMKDQKFKGFDTDLDNILGAVNDACKLQTIVIGRPVADFANFLFSASPVIRQTQNSGSCNHCFGEQQIHNSLCWHKISNIPLKNIWQWYEEPGCFGLEVKAHDFCNSRRQVQNDLSEFSAYFVPFLSAVQLFGISRRKKCSLSGQQNPTCQVDKTSLTSSRSPPIFSMLLPRPNKDMDMCSSEMSFAFEEDFSDKTIHTGHEELIFEYFESDQPPRRRPLYEKIKELASNSTESNGRVFGDPLNLESIELRDLHPASWYCVAWYPIYRIPDGNFHAAFLTYHSLGHFVHRNMPEGIPDGLRTLVSPVVGFQAYNHKGENWFQPRQIGSKVLPAEDPSHSNYSELIKERLRTLNVAASAMARAVVSKNNQRSVNRHPDFEFFLSRSW